MKHKALIETVKISYLHCTPTKLHGTQLSNLITADTQQQKTYKGLGSSIEQLYQNP